MSSEEPTTSSGLARTIGLLGATSVGVGAIVGGGILVMGGVAMAQTGPSALLAFALNGIVAALTALSYAELSSAFPESGGSYTFAKKVLSVQAAFAMGWVLWFASIVAAVLYALGFATYTVLLVESLARLIAGVEPGWLQQRPVFLGLAVFASLFYTIGLVRKAGGGGNWDTIGKVVVFLIVIIFGFIALPGRSSEELAGSLVPFFTGGFGGLITAMGFTFIALQGFDLIAAVGGEVKAPERTIPRAMLISLGAALVVYLPLIFVVSTVGVAPGASVADAAAENPETLIATAAERFMGWPGFWLVVIAAILSTLTALKANLFAASRVALTMAKDRTLPSVLARISEKRGTPVMAIYATVLALFIILLLLPDVASAGAAASLIFLISFALTHWTAFLARRRAQKPPPFRSPLYPLVPIVGGIACAALAVFQAIVVPSAGLIVLAWLGFGVILYLAVFADRARTVDAYSEANDPGLVRFRGRSPLALVPIANPENAASMVAVAGALAPPEVGRVLLLTVVRPPEAEWKEDDAPEPLVSAQAALQKAMIRSFRGHLAPEALMTIAAQPWDEISRVAHTHGCESLLLGLSNLDQTMESPALERLMSDVSCDVAILHAHPGWKLSTVRRVLVPTGGRGGHDELRARLLGSLARNTDLEVLFLKVLKREASPEDLADAENDLQRYIDDEVSGHGKALVEASEDPAATIIEWSKDVDLVILGVQRGSRKQRSFGPTVLRIAHESPCATILISRGS